MQNIRQSPGFPLVKNNMTGSLPVNDPEYITCWENLEYSILKLEDEQFNLLLTSNKSIKNNDKKSKKIINTMKDSDTNQNKSLIKPKIENDFISEMEKMFEKGDSDSIIEVLKSYENK